MRTLNSHPYPLALCQMVPTVSGSSFFSTHYHFIKPFQVTRRLLPISLTRLQLFKYRLYRLDDVGYNCNARSLADNTTECNIITD